MSADYPYDPVTAVDEAAATGATAATFADIRETMGIPLVTSIWRGLAGIGDGLPCAWRAAKPIYVNGRPDEVLARVVDEADLPLPEPLAPTQLACAGIDADALDAARTIIDAYNRSNGMNMVALTALVAGTPGVRGVAQRMPVPVWPPLAPLPAREHLDADTWDLIRHVNGFGARSIDAGVATLWRHLGHWPALLAVIHAALAPLDAGRAFADTAARMVDVTRAQAPAIAAWRGDLDDLDAAARDTITGYVHKPQRVARMVTIGHVLARWLAPQ